MNKQQLRRFWFQIHKWIGLLLAALIIPISLTGAALVWHDWLDETLNTERRVAAAPTLAPAAYASAAQREAVPGERLLSLSFPEAEGAVVATLAGSASRQPGRPVRTILHLHPQNGRLLDRSAGDEGAVRVMHVLHGSLMIPGTGRQIVGWTGVAMLVSSLTGLWLWWPVKGSFRRGLRWRRQPATSGNLHHQAGFWIALPLAILSLSGAWISFPAFFAGISGDPAGPSAAERARRMGAAPIDRALLSPDQALAAASRFAAGPISAIAWPTEPDAQWKVSFRRDGGPAEVMVDDRTGTAKPPKPPQPETTARLMRRIHDGTGTGPVWQVIIFLGGLAPALLAVTGILMWLRARRRRGAMQQRRAAPTQPQVV